MKWEPKPWGKTKILEDSIYYSKHELIINQGGYCSLHYHTQKANKFILISGDVHIVELFGPQICETKLEINKPYSVASLVPHFFAAYTDSEMIEVYYPDRCGQLSHSDIIRLTEGGNCAIDKLMTISESFYKEYMCKEIK
jgi:hypothetical protein